MGSFQDSGLFPFIVWSVGGVSGQGSFFNPMIGDFLTFPSSVLLWTPVIECLEQHLAWELFVEYDVGSSGLML